MKKRMSNIKILMAVLLFGMALITACSDHKNKPAITQVQNAVKYTCPMHSQILEDHPGSCPICGMTLVKKSGQASKGAGISLKTVLQSVNASVISTVEAIVPEQKTIPTTVSANGYLDFDTRTFNNIAARFSGRIEKLYIKYAFQEIHRGQRIFDIYSPELVTAQQNLIFVSKNSPQETGLISAAKQKLLLLGMTNAQVAQVLKTGKSFYSLPVFSPYEGHVHDMPHSQMQGAPDTKMPTDVTGNQPLAVKEGIYVERGQTLFNVVDPHHLWTILKIQQADVNNIRLGQPVTIAIADADMQMNGKIDFIEPILQAGDRSVSVRVYLNNHQHGMKVGSLIKAEIITGQTKGLWIPRSALTDLGKTKIVWLKKGGTFEARQVSAGLTNGNQIQITKGLTIMDSLASHAEYLTDSESFIKTKGNE
ncbi:HlyD family efflux transporter periplasmic adaptor subunit [Mucilaginibacter gossypii]|uniref:Membrane fusion protein, Cu(I)/Ag(I) efflux system n=1 Tax=Mucilaginibacter gossypii TaxID=551996 RepID=A0A1G7RPC0_9SPHI|nr:HlyD family efflux transporter periplasmic adaptor subunit [Mucilaginibacter gossypii]SDG12612.1 membrane fusion protein, Cu(I)/Ag(I) efflux system [Mucilaginibacter gossypii]